MTGYEALALVHTSDPIVIQKATILRVVPSVIGSIIGSTLWPAHPVLGALDGSALARNLFGVLWGDITVKEAVKSLGSHAIATGASLSLKSNPAFGYVVGALAGGLVGDLVNGESNISEALIGTIPQTGQSFTDYATVLAVQKALEAKGFHLKKGIDGVYGPDTAQAIKKMQNALGAEETGVIDYGVLSALQISVPERPLIPLESASIPTNGRPAKGWSQPQPDKMGPAITPVTTTTPTPAWKTGLLVAGVVAGVALLGSGIYITAVK